MVEHPTDIEETTSSDSRSSLIVTLLVFMACVLLVRFVMPRLVEEVHYAMELGRQRAQYEVATQRLADNPFADLSTASQLVSRRIAPSVVHIDTSRATSVSAEPAIGDWNDDASETDRAVRGQGSGVIISATGEIITNYHVIQEAESITVTLSDDREFEARVIGVDRLSDLALLQIEADKGLVPATWGDSAKLQEGSMVWAVGSPFGLSKTITFGILSAKARRSYDRGQYHEFLQSDAAVSAGNSGGPLVDSAGNVVGINTAIVGPMYQGVSFSIPSNRAKEIYENELAKGPSAEQPWLGVRLTQVALSPTTTQEQAVMIAGFVQNHSPAQKAGIKKGDIITKWNDHPVDSPAALRRLVALTEVNEDVKVQVKRGDTREELDVRVGVRPLQF